MICLLSFPSKVRLKSVGDQVMVSVLMYVMSLIEISPICQDHFFTEKCNKFVFRAFCCSKQLIRLLNTFIGVFMTPEKI